MMALDPPPYPIPSVLVLDDDARFLAECRSVLAPRSVFCTTSRGEAAIIARERRAELALVDLWLESAGGARVREGRARRTTTWGIDMIAELRGANPDLFVVLVTGGYAAAYREAAIAAGANAAVAKQLLGPAKLLQIIEHGMLPGDPRDLDPMTLERLRYEQVAAAYVRSGRSPTEAARELGISRDTVYRTLRAPTPRR